MYNEEQKNRYLRYKEEIVDTHQAILITRFNQSEEMERELEKDIAEFTAYELMEFYKKRNFSSVETLIVTDSLLSDYTKWAINNNLVRDGQNHHVELTSEILKQCVNKIRGEKKIITREQLVEYIEYGHNGRVLENPSDKFVLLALFEGIKGRDFLELSHLSINDFHGNKVTLPISKITFEVSDLLLKYAKLSSDEYTYYPLANTNIPQGLPRELKGDGIIKLYVNSSEDPSDFQRGRRLYNKVKRIVNWLDLNKEISANSLYESGKIDYIRRKAKEFNVTPSQILTAKDGEKENIICKKYPKTYRAVMLRKYGEYLE